MIEYVLIRKLGDNVIVLLEKELKDNNLVPSKEKIFLLANFNENQIEFFLNLVQVGYLKQINIDWVIEEIALLKEIEFVKRDILESLYFLDNPDINSRVLKFILDELKINGNTGVSNIEKLPCNMFYLLEIFEIFDDIRLRKLNLITEVINVFRDIKTKYRYKKSEFDKLEEEECLKNIHKLISNDDILDSFENCENEMNRKKYYNNMLKSFLNIPNFDICYKFFSNIAKNKRITNLEKIPDIIKLYFESRLQKRTRTKTFNQESLENILIVIDDWGSIEFRNLYLLFGFGLDKSDDDSINLVNLTAKIYEKLPKELANTIYNRLLYNLTHGCSCKMALLSDFICSLLDNDNFMTYLVEDNGFDFINYALCNARNTSKEETFEMYKTIGWFRDKLLYKELLDSFSDDVCYGMADIKRIIYSQPQVLDIFVENPEILTVLNRVMCGKFVSIADPMPESEMELLQKTEFLKSDFFVNDYTKLLNDKFSRLRTRLSDDSEIYFKILGVFDFGNTNFDIFARRIIGIEDEENLKRIYEAAIRNNENGEFVNNSIFFLQMITANNVTQINRYIEMLSSNFNDSEIKDDTKMVYQKK